MYEPVYAKLLMTGAGSGVRDGEVVDVVWPEQDASRAKSTKKVMGRVSEANVELLASDNGLRVGTRG
jgi:hypothetical protein